MTTNGRRLAVLAVRSVEEGLATLAVMQHEAAGHTSTCVGVVLVEAGKERKARHSNKANYVRGEREELKTGSACA